MRPGRFLLSLRARPKTLPCARPKMGASAFVAVLAFACAAAAQTPGACKTTLPPGVKADAPVPSGEKVEPHVMQSQEAASGADAKLKLAS